MGRNDIRNGAATAKFSMLMRAIRVGNSEMLRSGYLAKTTRR
jgi:hypothetical protein